MLLLVVFVFFVRCRFGYFVLSWWFVLCCIICCMVYSVRYVVCVGIVCFVCGKFWYSILLFFVIIECSVESGVWLLLLVMVWNVCVILIGVKFNVFSSIVGIGCNWFFGMFSLI